MAGGDRAGVDMGAGGAASSLNLTQLISNFTGAKTKESSSTTPSAGALANSQDIFGLAANQATNDSMYSALVDNILQQSAINFAPNLAAQSSAGVYNSSTLGLLQGQAQGAATAQATKAVLDAKGQATSTAAALANAQLQATRNTSSSKTATPTTNGIATAAGQTLLSAGGMKAMGSAWDWAKKAVNDNTATTAASQTSGAVGATTGGAGVDTGTPVADTINAAMMSQPAAPVNNIDPNSAEFAQALQGGGDQVAAALAPVDTTSAADAASTVDTSASNFQTTPSAISSALSSSGDSAGGVSSAVSSSLQTDPSITTTATDYSSAFGPTNSGAAAGLGTSTDGITYGPETSSSLGSTDIYASDAGAADSASTSSGGGSLLGYIGPIMNAYGTEQSGGHDYRMAVGGAVLNYFGFGWATPIVDAIVRQPLDHAATMGSQVDGNFGTFMSDPVGSLVGGKIDPLDAATASLDPANITGGNDGGSVGGAVGFTADPAGALLGGSDSAAGGISDFVNSLNPFGGGGCFITTAVCEYSGKPDDCEELQVLREFRDTWLEINHPEDIVKYYKKAPQLVALIKAMPQAVDIFHKMDRYYIQPAVEFIKSGAFETAYNIYTNLFYYAQDCALGVD